MTLLRWLFFTRVGPDVFGASVMQAVFTGVGVFTFLAGVLFMPSLGPTRVEMFQLLLLLAAVALLCTAVGQLAVVVERLGKRPGKIGATSAGPETQVPSP